MAIFTGHAHEESEWYLPWDGQNIGETNVAGKVIPTFIAGAARNGYYLDCSLNGPQLVVKRFRHGREIGRRQIEMGTEYRRPRAFAISQ